MRVRTGHATLGAAGLSISNSTLSSEREAAVVSRRASSYSKGAGAQSLSTVGDTTVSVSGSDLSGRTALSVGYGKSAGALSLGGYAGALGLATLVWPGLTAV